MDWKVPLTTLTIGLEEEAAALRVLRRGWLTMGPEVEGFEQEFAEAVGARYAVATANATDGLALCYDAVGVGAGDEIVMPALTFVAAMNVALRRSAVPILVDITSEDDLTLSVDDLAAKITPRTGLVVPMPYGGFAPDMDRLMEITRRHQLPVVEDACHAILGTHKGRKLGTFGVAGVFSFFGNKNMTTGEGGMIVTGDPAIAQRCRQMRNHGITRGTYHRHQQSFDQYDVLVAGHNFRMCELRAAIGREQLRKVGAANRRRGELASRIREGITARAPEVRFPFTDRDQTASSHHLLVAILPHDVDRRDFMRRMTERGIQTSIHYMPLHRFTHTTGLWDEPPHLPVLESIEHRMVSLPLGPGFTDAQVDLVVEGTVQSLR
ncbi:MAG: DegT/DnrJ/EryC1/StrS family aminotransferase [Candidatus Sumerlaeia bacterium]|nr:DegT/DnrJ/EryC1/StrS family aminotransferase [Candidatus Sumerlaeia bacterium]